MSLDVCRVDTRYIYTIGQRSVMKVKVTSTWGNSAEVQMQKIS